jgi:toxin ParE1/3/4
LEDLKHTSHRIERDRNLNAANRVCSAIYESIQVLRRYPHSGRIGRHPGTRDLVVPRLPYIVAYRVVGSEAIQILRVWHGAQDRH